MKRNYAIFLIAAPLLAFSLVAAQIYYFAVVWKYTGPETFFYIKPNEGFSSINSRLAKEELISSARLFHRYSQLRGTMKKFKAGQYKIKSQTNMLTLYTNLLNEKSTIAYFTVSEGKNMYEIGKMLEEKKITSYDEFITLCKDQSFVKSLGIKGVSVEGYLYPDTYDFLPGLSAEYVIKTMVHHFNKKTSEINFSDQSNQKMSKEEIVTLASIVEKETGDKKERPMIAGVFLNRLKIKMRLQSDPTTIYGIYEKYNGNITRQNLLTPTEYNTYAIKGLPIGPISNPGNESLKAVLFPSQHKYLYFVSHNDGTHAFSENYTEHQEAVLRWQKTAKNREGKSWRNKKAE